MPKKKSAAAAPAVRALTADQVWRPSAVARLDFDSTDDLEVFEGVVEQDRATRALELGLAIHRRTYNIYVSGVSGTGRTTIVKNLLAKVAPTRPVPPDWVYVNDFDTPDRPYPIQLPSGAGEKFAKEVEGLVEELLGELPRAFHAKEHQEKIQRILNSSVDAENDAFNQMAKQADKHGFSVRPTKNGLVTIPVVKGQLLSNKEVMELPERSRRRIEAKREKVEPLISVFLERARDIQVTATEQIQEAQKELGTGVAGPRFTALREAWSDHEEVLVFIDALEDDVMRNIARFLPAEDESEETEEARQAMAQRYIVNVFVDNSETEGAPVIFENHPTYYNLFGKVEKRVEQGMYASDLSLIRAGAVALANGGYLVLNTVDLFRQPMVWDNLKAVLRNREVAIEDIGEQMTFVPTTGMRPLPIPIDLKIILIGPMHHYDLLFHADEDFRKYFQLKAEFDAEIHRDEQTEYEVARFVATTCKNERLRSVDRDGVAAVVEQASRMVADQGRLTLRFNDIANLLIEADYRAHEAGADRVTREHVRAAVLGREEREGLLARKMLESILEEQLIISTEGERVGIINGLSVYASGDFEFGKPVRISARTYPGKFGIVNVEREARLSGSIHNKGVLILQGWLGGRYHDEGPLSLAVTLTMEQSYSYVDGDSASAAELYAVVSSLADLPLRQDLAVTGAVNQHGSVQAVGGINEKIEGFFELCRERGLTGTQGCLIPSANVRHLMLKNEVREAIAEGRFHVYPIDDVDQGLSMMTGRPAAEIHDLVAQTLRRYRGLARKVVKETAEPG